MSNQRKFGTCTVLSRAYFEGVRLVGEGPEPGCSGYAQCLTRPVGEFRGGRLLEQGLRRPTIRVATPYRAGETSRVVSSTPTWRIGVQCRRSVHDSIDLQRPHERTKRSWPDLLGMEAGAPGRPTAGASVQAVATGRRTAGANPLTPGNSCEGRPSPFGVGVAFFCDTRQRRVPHPTRPSGKG